MAKFDVYEEVTNQIVNALEAETPPWRKPWTGDAAGFAMLKQGEEKSIPFAKAYRGFNADQIEGLPAEFYLNPSEPRDLSTEADPELDGFFASIGGPIETSDKAQAYFAPSKDSFHIPPIETFHSANGYYATLAHGSIHFTGVEKRLDRYGKYSNKQEYAFEELVAEIGS